MKTSTRILSLYTTLLVLSVSILTSCNDDDPTGADAALGKQFNLAVGQITSSLAYSIIASADGNKVFATTTPTGGYYYSGDGGKTFTAMDNYYLRYAIAVDNQGNILTSDKYLFVNGTLGSVSSYDQLILGDNGKIFSYNANSNTLKYRSVTGGDFIEITLPSTPAPGVGSYVMKAAGKGLLYIEASNGGTATTVNAYLLDEATAQWSNVMTASFESGKLNTCNNLNRYDRYSYAGNNIVVAKGCTGIALLDLSNSNTTYINFPTTDQLVYEDVRDGQIFIDSKKQVYVAARVYGNLSTTFVFRYNGTEWSQLEENFAFTQMPVFTADQAGNIYYNAANGAGESIRGAVKLNIASNTKTALALPTTKLAITDAAAIDGNTVLTIVEGVMYEHDVAAGTTTKASLSGVNHINMLSDGRLLAGGTDRVLLSSDNGKTWSETKKIFSSLDANKNAAAVSRSRIVNGKIMMTGTYSYYYDNITLGVRQNKYDNIAISFDGTSSTKLPFTFPGDFEPSVISTDGTIYGTVTMLFEYQYVTDSYELQPNAAPTPFSDFRTTPQVITDSGLQLAIRSSKNGGLEVMKRGSTADDWESTNTPVPPNMSGTMMLRMSGDRLVIINGSEVYVSGN